MPLPLQQKDSRFLPFEYKLVRSARRRSLSIQISQGQVIARAPDFIAIDAIEAFLYKKSAWVLHTIAKQASQLSAQPEYRFVDGAQLPFLGRNITLVVQTMSQADVVLYGDKLLVILTSRSRLPPEEQARRLVCHWYQQQALTLLTEKTDRIASRLGVSHSGITLKLTRSKWGHCTAQGAIQYNWQILLAPEAIVDYLVAHEVSHIIHHNHSPAFWAVVASICPDYAKRRAWLKANGMQLMF